MPKGIGYDSEKKRALRAHRFKHGTPKQKAKIISKATKRSAKRKKNVESMGKSYIKNYKKRR